MRTAPLLIVAALIAAGVTTATAVAGPVDYSLLTTIAIPSDSANTQGGAFTGFDISFFDPTTGLDYVADRSNAAVDIFSGASNSFLGRATGFAGQQATTSTSGPDGVLVVSATQTLFAGDTASLLRTFNVSTPSAPTVALPAINTGGSFRVDEMSYAPGPNLVLAANNADAPAFATLVNASTGAVVAGHITIPGQVATGGLEQSVWNPSTGTFFISVPTFNGSDPGGLAEISTAGAVLRTFHLDTLSAGSVTSCSPTGLALGGSGNLMIGCGNGTSQTIVLNPAGNGGAGAIVQKINAVSASDELWYDTASGNFYVTGSDASGHRVIDVISDSTGALLQSIDLTALGADVNAHSVAVDPLNGEIFVPLEGSIPGGATDTLCPDGCIAVFAETSSVPEPGSLAMLLIGLLVTLGIAVRRRGRVSDASDRATSAESRT